jgi:hypothetical protein
MKERATRYAIHPTLFGRGLFSSPHRLCLDITTGESDRV